MKTNKKFVGFGDLLLRLQTRTYERFVQAREFQVYYTGAEANVAASLAYFGIESYYVSRVPDNEIGQAAINYLRNFGIKTDYLLVGGNRLGLFYSETGA